MKKKDIKKPRKTKVVKVKKVKKARKFGVLKGTFLGFGAGVVIGYLNHRKITKALDVAKEAVDSTIPLELKEGVTQFKEGVGELFEAPEMYDSLEWALDADGLEEFRNINQANIDKIIDHVDKDVGDPTNIELDLDTVVATIQKEVPTVGPIKKTVKKKDTKEVAKKKVVKKKKEVVADKSVDSE